MGNFNRGNRSGSRRDFGGGRRRSDGPTKMYKATCGNCGNNCEVPFKPTGERPVLCDDCFGKNRNNRSERGSREKTMYVAVCDNCNNKCEVPFRPTSGKPVYCSNCFDQMGGSDRRQEGRSSKNNELEQKIYEKIDLLNSKLDQIIESLTTTKTTTPKPKTTVKKAPAKKAAAKPKKTAKKKVAKKTVAKKKK